MNKFFKKKKTPLPSRKDVDVIKDLAAVLREHGDKILSGKVLFALNPSSLTCVNAGLAEISDDINNVTFDVVQTSNSKLSILQDLQFLYDFIQKVIALKLVHGNFTLQGRVNIFRFRNLKIIEIKKIPIHLVMGLQSLRPKLEAITCHRSIQTLAGLLAKCGGDMAQEFTWSELKNVDLSYNGIEEIDESLKLVPYLEILNLSHNNLKSTDNLQHSTILKNLSLAYNFLSKCPMLTLSCKSTLRCLNLSYNNLESLHEIDELHGLEELDVSGNCLTDHSVLQKIMLLSSLISLNLSENPLSYHKCHRRYCISYLHPKVAINKFVLDSKLFTKHEKSLLSKARVYSISSHVSNSDSRLTMGENSLENSMQQVNSIASSFNCSIDLDNSVVCNSSPVPRRKNRKISKIVDAVIIDPNALDDVASITTVDEGIKAPDEHLEIKSKIQDVKMKYGPEWLVAGQKSIGVVPTPIVQNNIVIGTPVETHIHDDLLKKPEIDDGLDVNDSSDIVQIPIEANSSDLYRNVDGESEEENSAENISLGEGTFYIVHLKEDIDSPSYILVVGSRYVVEKDTMTGKIVEELDLNSLAKCSINCEKTTNIFSAQLSFDYVKKSKRERCYYFENNDQLNEFQSQLLPFVAARLSKNLKDESMQCLKCSSQFLTSSAISVVKSTSGFDEEKAVYGSSKSRVDNLQEVPTCPNCKSDMLVGLENISTINMPLRKASTPLSMSPTQVSFQMFKETNEDTKSSNVRKISVPNANAEQEQKIYTDDATIYAPHVVNRVDFEVEAEVYNQFSTKSCNDQISKKEINRTDSDISILSNPSQSSIAILPSNEDDVHVESVNECSESEATASNALNNSCSDSLSDSVCTQLESSVYENGNGTNNSPSNHLNTNATLSRNSELENQTSTISNSSLESTFTELDCRLKLYFSMSFFDKDEYFKYILKAGIYNYNKLLEFEGFILLSNCNIYILKIIGVENYESPQSYLQKIEKLAFSNLTNLTVIFGRQGFQMEFFIKGRHVAYNVLLRDSEICKIFTSHFVDVMNEWSLENNKEMPLICTSTEETLRNISQELKINIGEENDSSLSLYIMGYWSLQNDNLIPVSFIFTSSSIYVTQESLEYPIPSSLSDSAVNKKTQFQVLDEQKIMDISEIEYDANINETKAKVHFLNEDTMKESFWIVSMSSLFSLNSFISAIRIPWETLFGVNLNMSTKINSYTNENMS